MKSVATTSGKMRRRISAAMSAHIASSCAAATDFVCHKRDLPKRSAALMAAAKMQQLSETATRLVPGAPTVQELVAAYLQERAPTRKDTRRSYQVWLRCHISPKWRDKQITDLQPRPVEVWLQSRDCSPKASRPPSFQLRAIGIAVSQPDRRGC